MSAAYENLQVYKSAKDIVVYFETIIRGFQRYHKYTIGSEMRTISYAVLVGIIQANTRVDRVVRLKAVLEHIIELKVRIEICAECKIFHNQNSYPTAIKKIEEISRQCEGWLRSCENPGGLKPSREPASMKSLGAHATEKSGIRPQGTVPQGSIPVDHRRR